MNKESNEYKEADIFISQKLTKVYRNHSHKPYLHLMQPIDHLHPSTGYRRLKQSLQLLSNVYEFQHLTVSIEKDETSGTTHNHALKICANRFQFQTQSKHRKTNRAQTNNGKITIRQLSVDKLQCDRRSFLAQWKS